MKHTVLPIIIMIAVVGFVVWNYPDGQQRDNPLGMYTGDEGTIVETAFLGPGCVLSLGYQVVDRDDQEAKAMIEKENERERAAQDRCLEDQKHEFELEKQRKRDYCTTYGPKDYDEYVMCEELKAKD